MQGAVPGTEKVVILQKGHKLDRFGGLGGRYMTDFGTPADMLALTPSNNLTLTSLQVVKPFKVKSGIVATNDFGLGVVTGGGIQYFAPNGVQHLIDLGFLIIIV
jgi:hypothetical protein